MIRCYYKVAFIIFLFALQASCSTVSDWFSGSDKTAEKPAPLPEIKMTTAPRSLWQTNVGGAGNYVFSPALDGNSIFAANKDGQITRVEAASGRTIGRIDTGKKLSGGVGAGNGLVVVGTNKGEVLAYDYDGKQRWNSTVSSEVLSAPEIAGQVVIVRTGDNRIFGLDAADGKRKWVYQRASNPPLTVRTYTKILVKDNTAFIGFPGGKLSAINVSNGELSWEATVTQPRGATELERVADITGLLWADERQVCAVAYQGRVGCFDISNGGIIWARELSSTAGLTGDNNNVYVTNDRSAVLALNKNSGASVWKQDALSLRRLSAPVVSNNVVVVGDYQGYVHFINIDDGSFMTRAATDGSAIVVPPTALSQGFVVQTRNGGLYAFSAAK